VQVFLKIAQNLGMMLFFCGSVVALLCISATQKQNECKKAIKTCTTPNWQFRALFAVWRNYLPFDKAMAGILS